MNKKAVIIFLTVFIGVYTLLNYYVYSRGYSCIKGIRSHQLIYNIFFGIFFFSFIIGKLLERTHLFRLSRPVSWVSSFWLGALLYFLLIILLIDLIRLADYFFGFLPTTMHSADTETKEQYFIFSVTLVALLLMAGFINARLPVIRNLKMHIDKKAGSLESLHIVAVSDIHLGILFGKHRMTSLARRIKRLNPDIVLFLGDLIDEVPRPVIEMDMGAALRELNVPYGKYAVTGNHEFIGGIQQSSAYIENLGITLLRDKWICINDSFIIAGRDDRDGSRFTGIKRKNLDEILGDANIHLPIILLDHQPFNLEHAEKSGVDLQLSGHTHHGQLWPLNVITNSIFELSWKYLKKGNTHYYVSSGYGTWMPQVRIGNRPEILDITLQFKN